jgi:GNAT superfamily N-acetyltransferase
MTDLDMRIAGSDEESEVISLWNEASNWLSSQTDQWQYPVRSDLITEAIKQRTVWLLNDSQGVAATVTLDSIADPRLWFADDHPEDALYVHRLVVARRCAGHGIGSLILDWAGEKTNEQGLTWLRLDAWTTNRKLKSYYLAHGFSLVRTVRTAGVLSGLVFQRPSSLRGQ